MCVWLSTHTVIINAISAEVVASLQTLHDDGLAYGGEQVKCILTEIRGDWKFQQVRGLKPL